MCAAVFHHVQRLTTSGDWYLLYTETRLTMAACSLPVDQAHLRLPSSSTAVESQSQAPTLLVHHMHSSSPPVRSQSLFSTAKAMSSSTVPAQTFWLTRALSGRS